MSTIKLFAGLEAEVIAERARVQDRVRKAAASKAKLEEDLTPRGTARECVTVTLGRLVLLAWVETEPRGPVRAVLTIAGKRIEVSEARPFRVADLCCAYGIWASEVARWWVHDLGLPREWLHITGVELSPGHELVTDPARQRRKLDQAAQWCDSVFVGSALDYLRALAGNEMGLEVAVGNPAFSLLAPRAPRSPTPEQVAACVGDSLVTLARAVADVVVLMHQKQNFSRGVTGRAIARAHPRHTVLELGGSIDFRGAHINPATGKPWGRDTHDHCATAWARDHEGPTDLVMGRELRTDERSWDPRVVEGRVMSGPRREPGTETLAEAVEMGLPVAPSRAGTAAEVGNDGASGA